MEKGFFKVFNPETSAKRMKIPIGYTNYKNGKLPRNVFLRDRFGNMWPIRIIKQGKNLYFQYGWEKFIKDNTLMFGDFLIFDNDGKGTFDFKLLGIIGCEKKGIGGEKKKEEINVIYRKSVKSKRKTWANDNNSSASDDDSAEDYMMKEEEDVEEEVEKEEKTVTNGKSSRSKYRFVEEEEDEKGEGEEEDEDEDEDEEENERAGTYKKKAHNSKVNFIDSSGCQKVIACKVMDVPDQYGADIFKSGRATQPKNPYFVAKIRQKRRDQLFVPMDVVRDYKLEFPPRMTIRDSTGREFETRVNTWSDGRIWLVGGWRNLCRWNLMEKEDRCICEFVRGKCCKEIYLQVQVLHEGSSSLPNYK